jgi:hypothetical protein
MFGIEMLDGIDDLSLRRIDHSASKLSSGNIVVNERSLTRPPIGGSPRTVYPTFLQNKYAVPGIPLYL